MKMRTVVVAMCGGATNSLSSVVLGQYAVMDSSMLW